MSTIRKQAMNWWNDLSEGEKQAHTRAYFRRTNQTSELILLERNVEDIYLAQKPKIDKELKDRYKGKTRAEIILALEYCQHKLGRYTNW